MRYRVWSETLALPELSSPEHVALLKHFRVEVLVAVRPWQLEEARTAFTQLQQAGIYAAAWPMLADADGRWASVASMRKFIVFASEVIEALAPAELILDLEPAFDRMRNWKALRAAPSTEVDDVLAFREAAAQLRHACQRWQINAAQHRQPLRLSTAIIPLVAFEPNFPMCRWWQRALGTPVDALPAAAHSVMAYTSLLEGWSRGLVSRRRAEWLLALIAKRAKRKWGAAGAVSLGTVAPGAFGDEPSYRDVAELAKDVAIVREAGIQEIALFDLGGIMQTAAPESWLHALTSVTR